MTYTEEKVLYFADRPTALHVAHDEPRGSDLKKLVARLAHQDMIQRITNDDSGAYWGITEKGKIRLLKLQIEWRKRNGKETHKHQAILEDLEAACA